MRQVTNRGFLTGLPAKGLLKHCQQHLESSKQVKAPCPSIHFYIADSCFDQESTVHFMKSSTSLEILTQAHVTAICSSSHVTWEPGPLTLSLSAAKYTSYNIFNHDSANTSSVCCDSLEIQPGG